jgi:RNA polymerase sigma-70 factor (ECF subfamily)
LLAKETIQIINKFLRKQDQQTRVLFVRRYWFGDSIEELSTLFGISRHQVSVRLHRIRVKLKKHLVKEGIDL